MALVVYNTRTRSREPFEPITPGRVGMYVCGPTVYDHPHLGHARAAVSFDVIRRTLEALGNTVIYVQNITDVDDKIINRAAEEGADPWAIAERYTRSYEEQMDRIGVRRPTITPKATGHIPDMIALIQRLLDAGFAYTMNGDVYFSVADYERYGSLSGRGLEDMRAGERVEVDERKKHPMDFALWKSAKEWQVHWPAPWGMGRPGWHIECSAMSMRYLGDTFDIHGGGQDLIFPHHENECAQAESLTDAPLARVWLHNGFVTIDSEKMSKSLKNYMLLADVLAEQPPPVVRLMLATVHYRSPLDMSADVLTDARGQWERFATFARNAAEVAGDEAGEVREEWRARFLGALEDDFNTPAASAVLHELITEANPRIDAGYAAEVASLLATFRELASILGLDPIGDWPEGPGRARIAPLVEWMIEQRRACREAKDFAQADRIREVLSEAGVVLEDRAAGAVRWYLADPWS